MQLERENQSLRTLLEASGLPRIWMDVFLKIDNKNGTQGDISTSQEKVPNNITRSPSASGDMTVSGLLFKPLIII